MSVLPDMPPIENIWTHIKEDISRKKLNLIDDGKKHTKNIISTKNVEIVFSIEIEWLLRKCDRGMPDLMAEFIQNKGSSTSY